MRKSKLRPPADVEYGVWKMKPLDVVVDNLLVVTEDVTASDGNDGNEAAGYETLDASCFGCCSKIDLFELFCRTDSRDNYIEISE